MVGSAGLVGTLVLTLGHLTKKSDKRALAMASEAASKKMVVQDSKKEIRDSNQREASAYRRETGEKNGTSGFIPEEIVFGVQKEGGRTSSRSSVIVNGSSRVDDVTNSKQGDTKRKSGLFGTKSNQSPKSPPEGSSSTALDSSLSGSAPSSTILASKSSEDLRSRRKLKKQESLNSAASEEDAESIEAVPGATKLTTSISGKKGNAKSKDANLKESKDSKDGKDAKDSPNVARTGNNSPRARSATVSLSGGDGLANDGKQRRASVAMPSGTTLSSAQSSKLSRVLGLDAPMTARSISVVEEEARSVFSLDHSPSTGSTSSLNAGDLMVSSRSSLSSSQLIRTQMQQLQQANSNPLQRIPASGRSSPSDSPAGSMRGAPSANFTHKMITSSAPHSVSSATRSHSASIGSTAPSGSLQSSVGSNNSGSSANGFSNANSTLITSSAPPGSATPPLAGSTSPTSIQRILSPNVPAQEPTDSASERFQLPLKDTTSSRRNLSVATAVPVRLVKRETFIKNAREGALVDAQRRKVVIEVRETFGVLDALSASESHSLFVRVAVCRQRFKTGYATRERGGRAKWGSGEMIVARVDAVHTDRLHFEVLTRDRLYLGHAVTRLSDLLKDAQKDVWLPLKGTADHGKVKIPAAGELRVCLTLLAWEDPIPLSKGRISGTGSSTSPRDYKASSIADAFRKKRKNEDGDDDDEEDSDSDLDSSATQEDSESYSPSNTSSSQGSSEWWGPSSTARKTSMPISEKHNLPPSTTVLSAVTVGGSGTNSGSTSSPSSSVINNQGNNAAAPGSATAAALSGGGWTGAALRTPLVSISSPLTRETSTAPEPQGSSLLSSLNGRRATVSAAPGVSSAATTNQTTPAPRLSLHHEPTSPKSDSNIPLNAPSGSATPLVMSPDCARTAQAKPTEPPMQNSHSPSGVPANAVPVVHAFTNPAVTSIDGQSELVDASVAVNVHHGDVRDRAPTISEIGIHTHLNADGSPATSPSHVNAVLNAPHSQNNGSSVPLVSGTGPEGQNQLQSNFSSSSTSLPRVSFSPDAVRSSISCVSGQEPNVLLSGTQYTPVAVYDNNFEPFPLDSPSSDPPSNSYFVVGKQGWLNVKLAFKQSKWESRWCVVDGNTLRIYEDKYSQASLATMPLFGAKVAKLTTRRHHIQVTLPKDSGMMYESAQLKPLPIPNDPASTHISPWYHQINTARKISKRYLDSPPPLPLEVMAQLENTPSIVTAQLHSARRPSVSIGSRSEVDLLDTSMTSTQEGLMSTSTETTPRRRDENKDEIKNSKEKESKNLKEISKDSKEFKEFQEKERKEEEKKLEKEKKAMKKSSKKSSKKKRGDGAEGEEENDENDSSSSNSDSDDGDDVRSDASGSSSGSDSDSDDETTEDSDDGDEFYSDLDQSADPSTDASHSNKEEMANMTPEEKKAYKKKKSKEAKEKKKDAKRAAKQAKKEAKEKEKEAAAAAAAAVSNAAANITSLEESTGNSTAPSSARGSRTLEGTQNLSENKTTPASSAPSSAPGSPRSNEGHTPRSSSLTFSSDADKDKLTSNKNKVTGSNSASTTGPNASNPSNSSNSSNTLNVDTAARRRISRNTSINSNTSTSQAESSSKQQTDSILESSVAGGIKDAAGGNKDAVGEAGSGSGGVRSGSQNSDGIQNKKGSKSGGIGTTTTMEMKLTAHDYDGSVQETEAKISRGQGTPSLSKRDDMILGVESALVSVGVMKEDEMTEYIKKEEEEERRSYVLANVTPLKRIPDNVEAHDAGFLNLVLWRLFRDMQTSELFANDVAEKIRAKIETVKLPPFLGNLRVLEMDYGKDFIKVDSIKVVSSEVPDEVIVEADVRYEGGLAVTLGIEFYINWPRPRAATIPVTAIIKLKTLRGKLHLLLPSQLNTKNSMCFVAPPAVDFDVSIDIGKGEGRRVSSIPKLKHFLFSFARQAAFTALVHPSRIKFFWPIPGRKVDVELSSHKDSARPKKATKGHTQILPRDSSDVVACKYVALEFFNSVLNLYRYERLDQLFAHDCVVYGTSFLDIPLSGRDAVLAWLVQLRSAFPDIRFFIDELNAAKNNISIQWTARGTFTNDLWDYPATGQELLLRGCFTIKVRDGNQLINEFCVYWSLGTIYGLI